MVFSVCGGKWSVAWARENGSQRTKWRKGRKKSYRKRQPNTQTGERGVGETAPEVDGAWGT